ncbi:hypothetical protein R1sor_012027 [Riccia sorocarpa]|uniref:Bet v I/Major latex protein domain-containing protein n=1 Tax=Riccia sorocarpa TaxID=122646 RepID=A0ABD3I3W9_9MARC
MMATVATSLDLKVHPGRMWEALKDAANFMPKAAPFFWKNWEVLEGSPSTVGSLILLTFNPAARGDLSIKVRVTEFDEEELYVTYESLLDSDPLYKQLRVTMSIDPGQDEESCVVTWSVFYEPVGNQGPPSKEARHRLLREMEAYLRTNDVYMNFCRTLSRG